MEAQRSARPSSMALRRNTTMALAAAITALLWLPLAARAGDDPGCQSPQGCKELRSASAGAKTASTSFGFEVASLQDYLSRSHPPVRKGKGGSTAGDAPVAQTINRRTSASERRESAEAAALRARLLDFENRQQEAMAGVARALAASKQREDDLRAQLAAAHKAKTSARKPDVEIASASPCDSGRLSATNDQLRAQLDEVRRQNARLNAKLRLASRATDLIFRLREQEPAAQPPVLPPNTASTSPSFTNAPVAPPAAAPAAGAPAAPQAASK